MVLQMAEAENESQNSRVKEKLETGRVMME